MKKTVFYIPFFVALPALLWRCSAGSDKVPEIGKAQVVREFIPQTTQKLSFNANYLMGKFDPTTHPDFVLVPAQYCSRNDMYLRKEVYEAFLKMHTAAKQDGIQLTIISATRNFFKQKEIWDGKWTGKRPVDGKLLPPVAKDPKARAEKILRYSSMPGSSRHHWGTDMDFNDLETSYFLSGKGKQEYDWLAANASSFGFCQPYTKIGKVRPYGYQEEHWHWSYMPTAKVLLQQYTEKVQNSDIRGFEGDFTADEIDIKGKYVLGVNESCK